MIRIIKRAVLAVGLKSNAFAQTVLPEFNTTTADIISMAAVPSGSVASRTGASVGTLSSTGYTTASDLTGSFMRVALGRSFSS